MKIIAAGQLWGAVIYFLGSGAVIATMRPGNSGAEDEEAERAATTSSSFCFPECSSLHPTFCADAQTPASDLQSI